MTKGKRKAAERRIMRKRLKANAKMLGHYCRSENHRYN